MCIFYKLILYLTHLCFSFVCDIDVAIVLIITMIAKIYFPEFLERNEAQNETNSRSFNYRRVTSSEEDNKESGSESDTSGAGGLVSDSSFEEDYDFISQQQALVDGDLAPTGSTKRLVGRPKHQRGKSQVSHLVDTFAFEQEQTSRRDVIKRLLICVISLNVTFVTWGVLQERMLTRRYPRFTGEFFTYSYALVFTNRFWTLIMSSILMIYFKPKRSSSTVIYEYSFPSISNMLSSWCQYESLRYVSFPAVTLFKSFKLAPVMAMGKFLGNKSCKSILHHNITFHGSLIFAVQSNLQNDLNPPCPFSFPKQTHHMTIMLQLELELELQCLWQTPIIFLLDLDTTFMIKRRLQL